MYCAPHRLAFFIQYIGDEAACIKLNSTHHNANGPSLIPDLLSSRKIGSYKSPVEFRLLIFTERKEGLSDNLRCHCNLLPDDAIYSFLLSVIKAVSLHR
jgi:hypothetical protein